MFSWDGLKSSAQGLANLKKLIASETKKPTEKIADQRINNIMTPFREALCDDMNTPQLLATAWEVVKSNIPAPDKYDLLIDFDEVLGLKLNEVTGVVAAEIPADIQVLAKKRDQLRVEKKFTDADTIRKDLESKGYALKDTPKGALISRS